MKRFDKFVIGICLILCIIFIAMLFYQFRSVDTKTLKIYYQVADKVGFNTNTDALYFGRGLPGSGATRTIQLNNSYSYPVMVSITLSGDITPYLSVSDNNFLLEPGELKVITYFIATPADTPYGNLTGSTTFIFKRA